MKHHILFGASYEEAPVRMQPVKPAEIHIASDKSVDASRLYH